MQKILQEKPKIKKKEEVDLMCKINGKKLEEARTNAGMSQRKLAELSGVSQNAISHYETGKTNPSDETVERICMILKVSKDDIEIKNVGYDFLNGEGNTTARVRREKGFQRYMSPIETEKWIESKRDSEKESTEIANALNSAITFGSKKYIIIDPTFIHVPVWQRHTDMAKATEIAENYEERKFDPIKAYIAAGKLMGTDGMHRTVARIKRNENLKEKGMPTEKVLVEILNCTEEEAINTFLGQQSGRKTMTTGDTYRAAIKAGLPEYVKFKQIFENNRIQISEELTEMENPIGFVRPSRTMLRITNRKEEVLKEALKLIKDLNWCGSTSKNAYTLRNVNVLIRMITVYSADVKAKLLKHCSGAVYFESSVAPIKSNAELYDFLVSEINKK